MRGILQHNFVINIKQFWMVVVLFCLQRNTGDEPPCLVEILKHELALNSFLQMSGNQCYCKRISTLQANHTRNIL
jgi:hypothetical protein